MNPRAHRVNRRWAQLSQLNDHLFLGGALAINPTLLAKHDITAIINATHEAPSLFLPGVESIKLWLEDTPETDISTYFDVIADHIHIAAQDGGKVLVHCMAGVSRSASLCLAYLMKYQEMTLRQAYHFLAKNRPMVRPNLGFWKQLMDYEHQLTNANTVHFVQISGSDQMLPDVYLVTVEESLDEEGGASDGGMASETEDGQSSQFSLAISESPQESSYSSRKSSLDIGPDS